MMIFQFFAQCATFINAIVTKLTFIVYFFTLTFRIHFKSKKYPAKNTLFRCDSLSPLDEILALKGF